MSFSISVTVDTTGLEVIMANCDTYPPKVGRKIGGKVETEARILAPYRDGHLKASIQAEYPGSKILARINVWQDYGIYQELGFFHKWRTRGKVQWVQNPFLIPAIEHWAGDFASPITWEPMFRV